MKRKPKELRSSLHSLNSWATAIRSLLTNIEWMSPEEVWRFYNGRANVENMIKEGILSYSLDINISHFYGANVAHFQLVMLAYNLMNLFKELVLGQRDKKLMGKWIRQRFL